MTLSYDVLLFLPAEPRPPLLRTVQQHLGALEDHPAEPGPALRQAIDYLLVGFTGAVWAGPAPESTTADAALLCVVAGAAPDVVSRLPALAAGLAPCVLYDLQTDSLVPGSPVWTVTTPSAPAPRDHGDSAEQDGVAPHGVLVPATGDDGGHPQVFTDEDYRELLAPTTAALAALGIREEFPEDIDLAAHPDAVPILGQRYVTEAHYNVAFGLMRALEGAGRGAGVDHYFLRRLRHLAGEREYLALDSRFSAAQGLARTLTAEHVPELLDLLREWVFTDHELEFLLAALSVAPTAAGDELLLAVLQDPDSGPPALQGALLAVRGRERVRFEDAVRLLVESSDRSVARRAASTQKSLR